MIIRIVRMEFEPGKVEDFLRLFESTRDRIRNFEGVMHLGLHRDAELENVYYTLSHWHSAEDLENYRKSELFRSVWERTRILFSAKPRAYSLQA